MKISLFLSSIWLFFASFFSSADTMYLSGTVKDPSGEALIGAIVTVSKDRTLVKGTTTNVEGKYQIELEPGVYQVEFAYTGFVSKRITDVQVKLGLANELSVVLDHSTVLEEVVVLGYEGAKAVKTDELRSSPSAKVSDTRSKAKKSTPRSGSAPAETRPVPMPTKDVPMPIEYKGEDLKVRGSAGEPDVYMGGILEDKKAAKPTTEPFIEFSDKKIAPLVVDDMEKGSITEEETPPGGTTEAPAPRAGLLTAGEWNDLHNWNRHWLDLIKDGEIDAYQKMYGFYPKHRYAVLLTNDNDFPIADAVVKLKSGDKTLWEARTDNTGKAELWAALFALENEPAKRSAEIWVNGQKHEIPSLKSAEIGFNTLKINTECKSPKNVDIVWAVDATGSMGDEIEYLKTELLDVIGRAKSRNPDLAYRMGTVFYKDKGDDYITRSSGLSPDISKTVAFIQQQFAGGGGDYPEAVHSALDEAIFGQKWSENAVARICFLVLDASPHQTPEVNESLQKSIREAARLGIRIVPIAASGIQKDTEFLMKFFGLATNGSYVFLTDHSGIGGKHMEPTTDEYKVEPLNDLLVRLITEYTSIESCEGKSEIRFENDPQQQAGQTLQALYYPNPAVDQFTLELPFEVQSVTIYDSEGKAVRKLEKPVAGPNVVQINDLSAGFYTIRILNHGLMQSGKLMVVRG